MADYGPQAGYDVEPRGGKRDVIELSNQFHSITVTDVSQVLTLQTTISKSRPLCFT
ncbi:MAG: hypothetical protein OEV27_12465 [Nitrospira sp.]|nr:hypothetical protein [Nitrospira sp.]MDH4251992.1 hypothetical protein [Nitrospira sp.]MDH4344471.1 hypothetical protein [Nitrospira sp.]MDH5337636.1 hypothetical protein [Nitrospira sp.]